MTTVHGDSCLKITRYPGSWVGSVALQAQGGGSGYPISYTWSNCSGGGTGSIAGDWSQITLHPVSSACTTVIGLTAPSSATATLTWSGNG